MATPHIERLVLSLSAWMQDLRNAIGEADAKHDFTQAQLVSALNDAIRVLMNTAIEKNDKARLMKDFNEYIAPEVALNFALGIADMPSDALGGLELTANMGGVRKYSLWTDVDLWIPTIRGYNDEEKPSDETPRWTEMGRKVFIECPNKPTVGFYLYLQKHQDVSIGDANDIKINDRFDNEIKEIAQKLLEKSAPIN